MTIRRTALAAVACGALALAACGGETEASEESTTDASSEYGGFDSFNDRRAALNTYACMQMNEYTDAQVFSRAADEVTEGGLLRTLFVKDDLGETLINTSVTLAEQGQYRATCDEASPDFEAWVKLGWSQYIDSERFTKDTAEAAGVFDDPHYALEKSGTAVTEANLTEDMIP